MTLGLIIGCNAADKPATDKNPAEWGKPNQGLTCNITTDKESYKTGEPIKITIRIKNLVDTPVTIAEHYQPTMPAHYPYTSFNVTNSQGQKAGIKAIHFKGGVEPFEEPKRILASGAVYAATITWPGSWYDDGKAEFEFLKQAGTFSITALYNTNLWDMDDPEILKVALISNTVNIRITDK